MSTPTPLPRRFREGTRCPVGGQQLPVALVPAFLLSALPAGGLPSTPPSPRSFRPCPRDHHRCHDQGVEGDRHLETCDGCAQVSRRTDDIGTFLTSSRP